MLPGVWKDSVNVELEKHSRQGWELVAELPGKEARRELYFKRPSRPAPPPEERREARGERRRPRRAQGAAQKSTRGRQTRQRGAAVCWWLVLAACVE